MRPRLRVSVTEKDANAKARPEGTLQRTFVRHMRRLNAALAALAKRGATVQVTDIQMLNPASELLMKVACFVDKACQPDPVALSCFANPLGMQLVPTCACAGKILVLVTALNAVIIPTGDAKWRQRGDVLPLQRHVLPGACGTAASCSNAAVGCTGGCCCSCSSRERRCS